jgi:hypothetical protein
MMEKYDGVRVYWDGTSLSYKSWKIPLPKSVEPFPNFPFEGELWYERPSFVVMAYIPFKDGL